MTLTLSDEDRRRAVERLKGYVNDELDPDEPIGDLAASLLLDYILADIGPSIYNGAIREAQTWLAQRIGELDEACWKPEFDWKKR